MFESGQPTRRDFMRVAAMTGTGLALTSAFGGALGCSGSIGSQNLSFSVEQIQYGTFPMQMGELNLPLLAKPRPVVVLLHGGYWRTGFDRSAMFDLARDLARIGYASWNLDYRRVGEPGGGWPGTLTDVAAGIDKLAEFGAEKRLDLNRVACIGHSAGGQLALWAAARQKVRADRIDPTPKVTIRAVVALSGVLDMEASARSTADAGFSELRKSVLDLIGGSPEQFPDRYAIASPMRLLPIGVPQLILHGTSDDRVSVEQSRAFGVAATATGDKTKVIELQGVNHFDVVKTTKTWWEQVTEWLAATMGNPTD